MTAATTGRCRNELYSGNLNVFAISTMVVVVATTFVYGEYIKEYNELSGPLCRKINKCCVDRKDECSVPVADTRCYCDAFCVISSSKDCCPDYWPYCRNETAPLGGFIKVYRTEKSYEPDRSGPFCQKIKQCCKDRKDECSVPVADTRCYCDAFCMNSTSHDCCPDYWPYCRNETAPTGGFVRRTRAKKQTIELLANPESYSSYDEWKYFIQCIADTVSQFPSRIISDMKREISKIVDKSKLSNNTCDPPQPLRTVN